MPEQLQATIAAWMAQTGQGSLRASAKELSRAYRSGKTSSAVDLAAYVTTRLPATFAVNMVVQGALADALPAFAPRSLLDIGTGPGVASWAALCAWPAITHVEQCERDVGFAALAKRLNAESGFAALSDATVHIMDEEALPPGVKADLVVASYMLAEVPLSGVLSVANRLWRRAGLALVLIEPGTPQGFQRLRSIRDAFKAHVVAPCTHHLACPMLAGDWCHFKTRVRRSREHMHAKRARVPFEDEAFSYLVLARSASDAGSGKRLARVIAPPVVNKAGVSLRLCAQGTITKTTIARRDKATYKRATHLTWGQVWE